MFKLKPLQTQQNLLEYIRQLSGLKTEHVFLDLRIPNQIETAKNDINIIILTGQGIFGIDLKPWIGTVSAHNHTWHVQVKQGDQDSTSACVEQVEDPVKAITTKMANLCHHLTKNGVCLPQSLFFSRVVFLSPHCELDGELRTRGELVSHSQLDSFFSSFNEGYVAWMSDALTPSWLSGHLSYKQMELARRVLCRVGTWDLVKLRDGEQLIGDYQGCRYIALDRRETGTLEFSQSSDSLWNLWRHTPQVTVKMYKRDKRGDLVWLLGKHSSASTIIPIDTQVVFRISGEETDTKILASAIDSITISI